MDFILWIKHKRVINSTGFYVQFVLHNLKLVLPKLRTLFLF